jgi:hypothetical protein
VPLFRISGSNEPVGISSYDVTADGQRFLVNSRSGDELSPPLTLLTDWTALLKE